MNNVKFKRCLKPKNTTGEPILIIFSDGSSNAYGACAYVRWKISDGQFKCRLILSKNRLAPIKRISVGVVLNSRLKTFLQQHCRYKLQRCYHIVDSQIVHSMIQKESYGFNTFAATRVGEIQLNTNPKNWFWIESKHNIADWLTRGKKPNEMNSESILQNGPSFLELKMLKMVKSIRYNCVICKKLDKRLSEQIMGKLPIERLRPSPAWSCTAIDLFGPFKIRDELKKRTTGKTYGVIFNWLGTRAVHVDLAADYSTVKFLMVLRRFVSIRKVTPLNYPQTTALNSSLQTKNCSQGLESRGTQGVWRDGRIEMGICPSRRALAKRSFRSISEISETSDNSSHWRSCYDIFGTSDCML